MTGEEIIALAIAARMTRGLVITFRIPDRSDLFVCYPQDEATKARWIVNGARKGWKLEDSR